MSPAPFAQPDDTGPILASDIAPSWSNFGEQEIARADLLGMTRGVNRMREYRQAESGVEDLGSQIGRLQAGEDLSDVVSHQRPPPAPLAPEAVDARVKQEGLTGHIPHPSPNPRVLDIQIAQAHEERDRETAIARGPQGFLPDALGLITSLGAGMIDPVNAAAFMIPVGGEAFWGSQLALRGGESLAARAAVKAVQGGAQGAAGGAALVPADWWLKTQDGQDYTMADALKSVLMSAGMGAAAHAGFGSIGDILRRSRGLPLKGSLDDLRLRAIMGDSHAAELVERLGGAGTHVPAAALGEDGIAAEDIPGIAPSALPRGSGGPGAASTGSPLPRGRADEIPPHPAEVLADLPPRAREDVGRAAIADLIAGRPVRAGEMLAEAAKEDPRIAESLERAPSFETRPAAAPQDEAGIDNSHDVVSGANSSADPDGPVYIDRRIPRFSPRLKDRNGQPADLHKYLGIHERAEAKEMARWAAEFQAQHGREPTKAERTRYYDEVAHPKVATPAERAAVEADGVDWAGYTHEMDGYLAAIEHEKAVNPPPDTHIDPQAAIGHHHSSNKQAAAAAVPASESPAAGPRPRFGTMTLALPAPARSMIENAERYKLAAKLRRERTGGAGGGKAYATIAAKERAQGLSPKESLERHAAATRTFDDMLAEHGIGAEDVPDDVRAAAIEAMQQRGFDTDPAGALDYAMAKLERAALADEDLHAMLAREELDGIDADRHVIATEEGQGDHDLHGDIPFDAGQGAAEGGRAAAGEAGEAPGAGGPAREDRAGARRQAPAAAVAVHGVKADFKKFAEAPHPVADPDLAAESRRAEQTPEPESVEPAKAVSAAQKAAAEAEQLLADILPSLSEGERRLFEDALNAMDQDHAAREQLVRDGAACLAAAVA